MSFWRLKKLHELDATEWEALCDGCGQCCLHKLEDEDTGQIALTGIACRLLDISTCRCTRYAERTHWVPECLDLRHHAVEALAWLPETCAYRLLSIGAELPAWHPLISGCSDGAKTAGVSVSGYALSEQHVADLEDHIIAWLN